MYFKSLFARSGEDRGETMIAQSLLTQFWAFASCSGPSQCVVFAMIKRSVRGWCVIVRPPGARSIEYLDLEWRVWLLG